MNINVNAEQLADGSARVKVECNGQQLTAVFTGTEVMIEVPEAAS